MRQSSIFIDNCPLPITENKEGVVLYVRVTPRAAKNRIGVIETRGENIFLKVFVTAPPNENQANLAVIETLSVFFDVASSSLDLIKGHTAREKVILIRKLSFLEISERLRTI